jgi:hypothetical protein
MKKFFLIAGSVVTIALVYYLFLVPYEFKVNFTAKTTPGDVISTLRIWNRSMKTSTVLETDSLDGLQQIIVKDGQKYRYDWKFTRENDSTTRVTVLVSEPGRRILNKLQVPFATPGIERDANDVVTKFYSILKEHLRITRVKIIEGEVSTSTKYCACSTVETDQVDKANGMMKDFPLLTSFISEMGIKPDGPPAVRVNTWDHSRGSLSFDFCFPIVPNDSLPKTPLITYKKIGGFNALRAEYYGNYITSDRAWYALIDYARTHGYKVTGSPLEYFYDNPNMGINESEWKAEIYLPVTRNQ